LTGKRLPPAAIVGLIFGLFFNGAGRLVGDDGLSPIPPAIELRLSDHLPADSPAVAKRIYRLRFSPSGNLLAVRDGANQVWQYRRDAGAWQMASRGREGGRKIEDLAYSADEKWLYGIAESGRDSFQIWSTKNMEPVLQGDSIRGQQLTLTLDGEMLVNGRDSLEFASPEQAPKVRKRAGLLRSWEGSVSMLMYNLAGQVGDSGLEWRERLPDQVPKVVAAPALPPVWTQRLQRTVGRAVGRQTAVGPAMQLSPDGNRVVLYEKRAILFWDVATDEPWRELNAGLAPPHHLPLQADIFSLRFSPNGQWLAISTMGESGVQPIAGEVHLVDLIAGRWLGCIATTTQTASALDFSPDQRWLAVGSTSLVDDRIQIIDFDLWLAGVLSDLEPAAAQPADLWTQLQSENPVAATAAVLRLRRDPVAWQSALTQALIYNPDQIVQNMSHVTQRLNSPMFQERESAEQELRQIAEHFPLLLRELQNEAGLSSESQFRLQRILAEASAVVRLQPADWRLSCRLLQALETLPEDWAQALLEQATQHPVRAIARQARVSRSIGQARRLPP
jgi:hypothetical protein